MKTQTRLPSRLNLRNHVAPALWSAVLCLFAAPTRAQIAVQEWAQRYGGGYGDNYADAIAVDMKGNVFVIGRSAASGGGWDYATIAYSSAGVPLWTNRHPARSQYRSGAVTVDASGNVIVAGSWQGGDSAGYATIKYSHAGQPLWTNYLSAPPNNYYYYDQPHGIAVDNSDNVVVAGGMVGIHGSNTNLDYTTVKYSSAGVPLWTNRYNGLGNSDDEAFALTVDSSNNVVVTGHAYGGSGTLDDCLTIKYSSAGVPLWTNRYNGPASRDDSGSAIAVDTAGNVFVGGRTRSMSTDFDYLTIKYSSAGVPLWTNRYNDEPYNGPDYANALAVDSNGNVIVTGGSYVGSGYHCVTLKYSNAGTPLWTNHYSRAVGTDNSPAAIGLDADLNVFVIGHNYATIAYSGAGVPLWTNLFSGAAVGLAVDASGSVYVTGSSANATNSDYTTMKYSVPRPIPLAIQRLQDQVVLSWTNAAFHLQCASAVTGTFTTLPAATSPCTNPFTGAQQFYRLIAN